MRLHHFTYEQKKDAGQYEVVIVNCENGMEIQIHESPTGRSVQIHAGSARVYPIATEVKP